MNSPKMTWPALFAGASFAALFTFMRADWEAIAASDETIWDILLIVLIVGGPMALAVWLILRIWNWLKPPTADG